MIFELPVISDAERTPLVEALLTILDCQQLHIQQLTETVQNLRDEIALLKGQKPRPIIAPSPLEKTPKAPLKPGDKRPGSDKRAKNASFPAPIEVTIPFPDPPAGSVSRGFEEYFVQELVIEAKVTRYLRERIRTPDGQTLLAPLPNEVIPGSHFGPTLTGFVLNQYHQCNVTQPLLLEQLHELGIDISAGQIDRLLTENRELFHEEKAAILPAALEESSYIGVDDTGARHEGHNGFCTALGNDLFAYFESTDSKSRVNFLQVLRGASTAYTINDTSLIYWDHQKLAVAVVERLCLGTRHFATELDWQARLAELEITSERHVRIATEGALLGQLSAQGVSPNLVILSDGAPQFDLFLHASCWIHIERPLQRVVPYSEAHRTAIEAVRKLIWDLYQELKAYRLKPEPTRKEELTKKFAELVNQKSDYPASIGAVLKEMGSQKASLLRVLDHPQVPLHNNGMESDIRGYVKTRKISGSTRSTAGRRCRDTFASLKKTCRKLGVSFWHYLQDRLRGLGKIPQLAALIRQRAQESPTVQPAEAVPA